MSNLDRYWLYRVIDELELSGIDQYRVFKKLSREPFRSRLIEIARDEQQKGTGGQQPAGDAIVAGSTMDMSGILTCGDYNCRQKQVDRLFKKTAHYFDSIVVDGRSANEFLRKLEISDSDARERNIFIGISNDIQMLVHLKKFGLDRLLVFHEKPYRHCLSHVRTHAQEWGLADLFDASISKNMVDGVLKSAEVRVVERENRWHMPITDPMTGNSYNGSIPQKIGVKKPTKRQAVEHMLKDQASALVSDFAISRRFHLPLAQEGIFRWGPEAQLASPTPQLVALELDLPYVNGLSTADLLKLRQDEHAAFENFQSAVTKAMQEQISRHDSDDPRQIARAVVNEYVQPELALIERRFNSARGTMSAKSGVTIAVGSLATAVGFASAVPLIATTGVAAAATVLTHINAYIDKKNEIKLSDLYFLWRAGQLHDKLGEGRA